MINRKITQLKATSHNLAHPHSQPQPHSYSLLQALAVVLLSLLLGYYLSK